MPHRNVGDGAGDQQPRRIFPKHEWQREQREPDHRLARRPDQDESLAMVEPVQDLDGEQLSPRPHELGQGREETDLERRGVEQQRKGGQVVLPPAHHDRLKSALADAVAATPLADRCGLFHAIAL